MGSDYGEAIGPIHRKLGHTLMAMREARGISRARLCYTTGWSNHTVQKLECGGMSSVPVVTIYRYLEAIGCDISGLIPCLKSGE